MRLSIRVLFLILTTAAMGGLLKPAPASAENARIEVILVKAGNTEGGVDSALRAYAGTLQRLFRFKSYAQVSRQSIKLDIPGEGGVSLAQDQRLSVRSSESEGRGIKADREWSRGKQRLLRTRIQLNPGNPAVLGGPRSDDGTWLLILQLR